MPDMATVKQLQVIRYIEENLSIRFEGTTTEEARDFISENMEASKRSRQSEPPVRVRSYSRNERIVDLEIRKALSWTPIVNSPFDSGLVEASMEPLNDDERESWGGEYMIGM